MSSLVGLATTAIKIGKNEEAARAAERILSVEPSNEAALRIRYNAAIELGDPTLLVDALVGLAAVEPKVARDGLLALAFEAYDANDLTLAATRFEKLLLIDPSDAKCHYYLGLIYVNEGANDKAKSHLEQFIQQAPDDPDAQSATDLLAYLNKG
jgi:tetratricopeptide (TPR) repeat protein